MRVLSTGLPGLDHVLKGGLPAGRTYLVQGEPGAGKTTLGLQFLLEGRRRGESCVYIALGETRAELEASAAAHGWSLEGIHVVELSELTDLEEDAHYTMFHSAEVELGETARRVVALFERARPVRLVFDSLSELRLLARDPLRYRRQILAFKQLFADRGCTTLLLDDSASLEGDLQIQSIPHGVIQMQHVAPEFGTTRRRVRVVKLRGVEFVGGYHDFVIRPGGVVVFPRLTAADHEEPSIDAMRSSGIPELDALCGGGLDRGASALLIGPAGTGKSSVAAQFVASGANAGERGAIFTFDERAETFLVRARGLGMNLDEHVASGRVVVRQIDPAELSPGELAYVVKEHVREGARTVVIDSLNGYLNAMPEERFLLAQMHELLTYLGQRGVVTILTVAQHGFIGSSMHTPIDLSYLADTALVLRFFEAEGSIRRAISVMKRRRGLHEATIRELSTDAGGIHVGQVLREFRGVLTGVPTYEGSPAALATTSGGRHGGE